MNGIVVESSGESHQEHEQSSALAPTTRSSRNEFVDPLGEKTFPRGPGRLRNDLPSVVHGDNSASGSDALPSISQRATRSAHSPSGETEAGFWCLCLALLHDVKG
ncbi:hypothetical protein CNYM01_10149 [Colletotrichum nymphaeae SA-01]|uniref:Uncharacterized protein n=1 Tax=Colletotrichum nymphaeae SA-01 TaxID=1460502 RepID=A0A135U0S2_9PEZI|nr:hypothetical protein CNYM01_10149 [Colletotrichum nymphaeae SA-01]